MTCKLHDATSKTQLQCIDADQTASGSSTNTFLNIWIILLPNVKRPGWPDLTSTTQPGQVAKLQIRCINLTWTVSQTDVAAAHVNLTIIPLHAFGLAHISLCRTSYALWASRALCVVWGRQAFWHAVMGQQLPPFLKSPNQSEATSQPLSAASCPHAAQAPRWLGHLQIPITAYQKGAAFAARVSSMICLTNQLTLCSSMLCDRKMPCCRIIAVGQNPDNIRDHQAEAETNPLTRQPCCT